MDGKFRNRYRVGSARAPWWDYGNDASYFVTVCTRNKERFFGEIQKGTMQLSAIGSLVYSIWSEIPFRFSYVKPGPFVVMPNHIHAMISIDKTSRNPSGVEFSNVETRLIASLHSKIQTERSVHIGSDKSHLNPTNSFPRRGGVTGMHNPMLHQNLSRVMRWFTGRVTFEAHKIDPQFNWQRRFHDHIVRDIAEFKSISRYIIKNPENWEKDQFY